MEEEALDGRVCEPIGPILDGLGTCITLRPSQRLESALVLGRIQDLETGKISLVVTSSEGLDWMLQRALVELAKDALQSQNGPI